MRFSYMLILNSIYRRCLKTSFSNLIIPTLSSIMILKKFHALIKFQVMKIPTNLELEYLKLCFNAFEACSLPREGVKNASPCPLSIRYIDQNTPDC